MRIHHEGDKNRSLANDNNNNKMTKSPTPEMRSLTNLLPHLVNTNKKTGGKAEKQPKIPR